MNWLVTQLIKEARGRRFNTDDQVRYFTEQRKGKGKGVVLTPSFSKGTVVDYDNDSRRYKIKNKQDEIIDVHPRNLMPDSFARTPTSLTVDLPSVSPVCDNIVINEPVESVI